MSKYKKGDKVVVEIKFVDEQDRITPYKVGASGSNWIAESDILGKPEDFQPKPEKIKMTTEMKNEFDDLDISTTDLISAFNRILRAPKTYPNLYDWIINSDDAQCLFSKAWHSSSLIEVVEPEKIKFTPDMIKMTAEEKKELDRIMKDATLDEVKEAEKQLGIQGLQAKWHEAAKKG